MFVVVDLLLPLDFGEPLDLCLLPAGVIVGGGGRGASAPAAGVLLGVGARRGGYI